jgi:lysozyme family protein
MANIARLIAVNAAHWRTVAIAPRRAAAVDAVARRLIAPPAKAHYQEVETATDVPWFIIAVIHEREADQSWSANIAQGDPWNHVSRHVPRGRGPFSSWKDAAVDALCKCAPFAARWKDWSAGGALALLEMYNGTGYEDYHHEASPYIWGATNHEEWGKYTSDGHWSAHVWDMQLGCAAMLKRMSELDTSVKFADAPQVAAA